MSNSISRSTLIFLSSILLFALIIVLTGIRPVPKLSEQNKMVITGKLSEIYVGGINDICFRLIDNPRTYYINRGIEQGMNVESLKEELLHKEVKITFPEYFSFLNYTNSGRHVSRLESSQRIIYSEM